MQLATVQKGEQSAKGGDDHLDERQCKDPELLPFILYLEESVLLKDEKEHRRYSEIVLICSQTVSNILYHKVKGKTLTIITATED